MTEIIELLATGGDVAMLGVMIGMFKLYQALNAQDRRLLAIEIAMGIKPAMLK